jgi:hypothetical protein
MVPGITPSMVPSPAQVLAAQQQQQQQQQGGSGGGTFSQHQHTAAEAQAEGSRKHKRGEGRPGGLGGKRDTCVACRYLAVEGSITVRPRHSVCPHAVEWERRSKSKDPDDIKWKKKLEREWQKFLKDNQ